MPRESYNQLPSIEFRTPLEMKKSVNPLSSYEMALVADREDRWSVAALSNLSVWTSCRRYNSSSWKQHQNSSKDNTEDVPPHRLS